MNTVNRLGGILLVGLAVYSAAPAGAATNLYQGPTWDLIDSKAAMAAAAAITLSNYPDCDEATVDKRLVRLYNADGTGECQDEAYTKVLTEKGKRNNRTLSLSFMLPYSTEEVVKLEVIKPDGTVEPVDIAANSKETIDEGQMQMNIYDPNSRILQVNLPKVEIGDTVHSVSRQTITRAIMPGEYAEVNVFEYEGFIRHVSYEVHSPAERPLQRIVVRDPVEGTITYTNSTGPGNTTIHHWEVNNVPRMFDEPSMPPGEMVLQRILVSTTPVWQDVSKWYWNLSKPHLDTADAGLTNQVNELIAGAKTDMEKMKAVFYHVSQKIRYMGLTPEKDRPGFEPHDVKITFDKKYGVCRDKAALLVSMLRAAGLQSYPVLINVGNKLDMESPDPFFNHAIVSVDLGHGKYVLMDPTDEHTLNLLPSYDCNQTYLVCRPEGENLQVSAVEPPEDNMLDIKTTGSLTAQGALKATSVLNFGGVNDDAYRSAFARMKPDDRRRFFEKTLKTALPGARLTKLKLFPDDMQDRSAVVQAEVEYEVDGVTANGNGKSMVTLPWIGKNFGIVNFILGGCGLEKRKYPMRTEVACGMQERINLELSGGFSNAISMPTCPPVDDASLRYDESVASTNGTLACARDLKLKTVEFSPKAYLTLKQTLKSMEYDERKSPVLATTAGAATEPAPKNPSPPPPVESDAKILESRKELILSGPHASVFRVHYTKEILNYAGKVREADIKIGFNPACEEARLVKGIVTSKSGQRHEVATNEINVMDAAWNPSAKRYTGGKTLVANLPGVEIGSTIEVEIEITGKNRPFIAGFEPFQLRDALEHKSFQVVVPAGLAFTNLIGGASNLLTVSVSNESTTWTAAHVAALPNESQLPPEWAYTTGVQYFAGDAKAYWQEVHDTMVDRAGKAAKAAETAARLVSGAKSKTGAITAIRDFVAKSIRSAGPSFIDLPLSELSAADTTLADGYGHAADRAILLYALLRAAGFEPQFVLASGLPRVPAISGVSEHFPLPYSFQSPLVRVTVDGQTYYLNDTDQYAQLGETGADGKQIIALPPGDGPAVEIAHAVTNCVDKVENIYTLSVAADGKTRIGVARRYFGSYFEGKNRYFSELPPEERRRYFQEAVSDVAQGARAVGDLTTKFDTYPGLEEYTVDVDNYAVVDGKYLYFDLPFTPSLLSVGADQRTLPFFLNRTDRNSVHAEITLPEGFRRGEIAPPSQTFAVPESGGTARITVQQTPGHCVIDDQFDTAPVIVPPADYPAVLKLESALERRSSRVFLFSSVEP